MKKHIVLSAVIALAILPPSLAHAQSWSAPTTTPPGGNIASPVNTGTTAQVKNGGLSVNAFTAFSTAYFAGNVGIGTTTPGYKLDVSGSANTQIARIGDGTRSFGVTTYTPNSGGIVLQSGTENRLSFAGAAGSVNIGRTYASGSAGVTDGLLVEGNVGLGTTTPNQKLSVIGNVLLGNSSDSTIFAAMGYNIFSETGYSLYTLGSGPLTFGTASQRRMTITSAGNIGIATTSPLTALAVTGQITTTGGIRFADGTQQTTASSGGFTPGGTWRIPFSNGSSVLTDSAIFQYRTGSGSGAVPRIEIYDASTRSFGIGLSALINATNASAFNTALGDSGLNALTSGVHNTAVGVLAGTTITTGGYNTAVGSNALSGVTTNSSNTAVGYSALLNNSGSSNTAIGQSTGAGITSTSGTFLGYGATATNGLTNVTAIGVNAGVTASNSLVLGNAQNVGIGVSAPGEKLTVSGGSVLLINQGSDAGYHFTTNGGTTKDAGIYESSSNNLIYKAPASGSHYFFNQAGTIQWANLTSTGLTVNGTGNSTFGGNLGIGTTSPLTALAVNGTITTTGGVRFSDGTTQTSASSGQWTTSGSDMYNSNSGNIGIGATSPVAKLDVSHVNGIDSIRFANQSAAVKGYLSEKSNGEIILSNNVNISDALDNSAKSAWKLSLSGSDSLDAFSLQAMTAGAGSWGSQRTVFKVNNAGTLNGPYTMSIGQSAPPTDAIINAGTNNGAYATAFHGSVTSNSGVGAILDVGNGANTALHDIIVLNRQVNGGTAPAVGLGGAIKFNIDAGSAGAHAAESAGKIATYVTATNGVNNSTAMTFSTDNLGTFAERMRIDNLGNMGIGTTSPLTALAVTGTITTTGGVRFSDGTTQTTAASGGGFTPGGTWRVPFSNGSSALSDSSNFQYLVGSGSAGVARLDINPTSRNIAIGNGTLNLAQTGTPYTGYENTGVGWGTLVSVTTGASNVAVGARAVQGVNTGSQNVGVGRTALAAVTSGNSNVGIGDQSATGITTGSGNIGIGLNTMYVVVNAPSNNIAIGNTAMYNVSSSNNVAIGANAMETGGAGSDAVAVGYKAMNNWGGPGNTAVGSQALYSATNGSFGYNTAVGYKAIFTANTNAYNTGIGGYALTNTAGGGDTALGYQAGSNDTGGNYNTYIGYNAGVGGGSSLTNTTSIGANAKATNSNTIILGDNSVKIATGPLAGNPSAKLQISNQTNVDTELIALQDDFPAGKVRQLAWKDGTGATLGALGMTYDSATAGVDFSVNSLLYGGAYKASTSIPFIVRGASGNVGIGNSSPSARLTVGTSIGITGNAISLSNGAGAAAYTYTGPDSTHNLAVGWDAGGAGIVTTFSHNNPLYIEGSQVWINALAGGGNVGVGTTIPGYKLEVNGSVGAASFFYTSDKSLKKNIKTLDSALDKITKLRGVSFDWKKDSKPSVGLIAQEVEKVYPELVNTNPQSGLKSVEYGNLVGPLIEAIKEQQKQIDTLKSEVEALKQAK